MPPPRGTSCSSARARRRSAVRARGPGTSTCSSRRGCSAPAARRPSGRRPSSRRACAGRPVFSASWWIGICPTARGKVIGTRPPGFTAPDTTRAIASGPRVPRCQVSSTAGARSIQSSTTSGRPVASSTMNGTPVSAIAWMRRSCSPGRRMSARELASPEIELGSPTATIDQVALGGERGGRPMSAPTAPGSRAGSDRPRRVGQLARSASSSVRVGAEMLHPCAEMIGARGVRAGQQDARCAPERAAAGRPRSCSSTMQRSAASWAILSVSAVGADAFGRGIVYRGSRTAPAPS